MVTVSEFIMRLTVDNDLYESYRNTETRANVIAESGMSASDKALFANDDQEGILDRVAEEGFLARGEVDPDPEPTRAHGGIKVMLPKTM